MGYYLTNFQEITHWYQISHSRYGENYGIWNQ